MFWRLFGTFGALLLSAIGLLGFLVVQRVEQHYLDEIEESLRTKAVLVREAVRGVPPERTAELRQRIIALRPQIATRITLIAADGKVVADSEEDPDKMENHADRPEFRAARESAFGRAERLSNTLGQSMMYLAMRTEDDGGVVAFVRVALPLASVKGQLAELRRLVWTAVALTGLAAVGLAFWLARRITRPIEELTASAEQIAAGSYGHRVYAAGNDEVTALARTFNYMSERLAAQFAQLAADREQLRMILSGMVEGVVALDEGQRVLFANERAAELLAFPYPVPPNRKLWEMSRRRALQDVVQHALGDPEPHRQELVWNGPTERSLTVHAARLPGSPPRGVVLVLHDTSELRRLERLRQEFVANVSHELKTPLSVIQVCVETLLDGALDDSENRRRFVDTIGDQAARLHVLILDLLSLARIESGEEAFEFQQVALAPIVGACLERHRARAAAKKQTLHAGNTDVAQQDSEPPAPAHCPLPTAGSSSNAWADPEAVGQILDNLVDNAVKYTPEGGRIQVRWHEEDGHVCLDVEDTGIGIPEQDLPRVFERFYRVDKARSRELGGTGLGLAIVKHLVQAMHGSVRATSRVGQGTTFHVRLPKAPIG